MTPKDELEPPADISWVTFEEVGMSYRTCVLLSIGVVLAALTFGAAILAWLLS